MHTREHHPQDGARAADSHRHGDAGDVAQAHRRRERGRERLEVRDLAALVGAGVAAAHAVDRVAEAAEVHELEVQREPGGAQDQPQHDQRHLDRVAPEGHVDEDDGGERVDDEFGEESLEPLQESGGALHRCPSPRWQPGGGRPVPRDPSLGISGSSREGHRLA